MFSHTFEPQVLFRVLAQRFDEVAPPGLVELTESPLGWKTTIRSEDGSQIGSGLSLGAPDLRLPLPRKMLLQIFFENRAEMLRDTLERALGRPWPEPEATTSVKVTSDTVNISFGVPGAESGAVSLRPISITELT